MLLGTSRDRWLILLVAMAILGVLFFVGARYQRPKPALDVKALTAQPSASPSSLPSGPAALKVDVEGSVLHPGLQNLPSDARVSDAITAAGGKGEDADTEPLNLAAKLVDGSQVYVPHRAKPEADKVMEAYRGGPGTATPYDSHPSTPSSGGHSGGKKHPSGSVSLNTGSESQLESLPGVGPSTAKKILEYRQAHGGFSSIDELMAVKGIGPKKLKAMRQWLKL